MCLPLHVIQRSVEMWCGVGLVKLLTPASVRAHVVQAVTRPIYLSKSRCWELRAVHCEGRGSAVGRSLVWLARVGQWS